MKDIKNVAISAKLGVEEVSNILRMCAMKKFISIISILVISISLSIAMTTKAFAAGKASTNYEKQSESEKLRTVAPDRARFVFIKPKPHLTAGEPGGTEVTCCTNWNTSTGGTGCATFQGSCPDDQFQVDCGDGGCW